MTKGQTSCSKFYTFYNLVTTRSRPGSGVGSFPSGGYPG